MVSIISPRLHLQNSDNAFNRGLEEGRATMKTISQASYERGLNEGKQSSVSATTPDKTQINESVRIVFFYNLSVVGRKKAFF